jgi:hypothetical protein
MTMKIDTVKWNADRREVESRIRLLKKTIKSQPTPPYHLYRDIREAKQDASSLYRLRAHLRGKLHQQKEVWQGSNGPRERICTMEDQQVAIERLMPIYVLPEAA